ncbi:MAG TPA: hypothetical protein VJQ51_14970 [Burkholderiales bacterium]|nr:hypothetical protein [Burkholderiales bacterium]
MDKQIRHCEIIYVSRRQASGWTWKSVSAEGEAATELYGLYYECVVAARTRGYRPLIPLKCS